MAGSASRAVFTKCYSKCNSALRRETGLGGGTGLVTDLAVLVTSYYNIRSGINPRDCDGSY